MNNACRDNVRAKAVTKGSGIVSNREITQNYLISGQQDISDNRQKIPPFQNYYWSPEEIEGFRQENKAEGRDDIIIACDVDELAKLFFKEYIIIWYDPKAGSESSLERLKKLNANIEVKVFNNIEEASYCVKTSSVMCQIITPNINGEFFVEMISDASSILSIYVLCDTKDQETEWIKKHPKISMAGSNFTKLTTKMHNDSLKMDFPAFAPVFDDMDKSKTNKLHFYLKGLVHFYNGKQAKDDLLALAHKVYKDKQNMQEFTDTYTKYDMALILTWYTKQSFLYKMVNNCLRIATSDSILYTRLVIKDLETGIKERFQTKSKHFDGLLYRGTYLSDQEWISLQASAGKEIEMFGFLSTSRNKDVGIHFAKQVLITVIVPAAPGKGEQGFAEVQEFSGYEEDEILFNIGSRFTVVATMMETNSTNLQQYRHLILLYGARTMRSYITYNNPMIQVAIKDESKVLCEECCESQKEHRAMFVNLTTKDTYLCMSCMTKTTVKRLAPYLSIPQTALDKKSRSIEISGMVMQYKEDLDMPFYGSKCVGKSHKNNRHIIRQFSCVECCKLRKIWCEDCFGEGNECLQKRHNIIVESSPCTFWFEGMSREDQTNMEYQKQTFEINIGFEHGKTFTEVADHDKAIKYYAEYIKRFSMVKDVRTAFAYNELAMIYDKLGNHRKAIELFEISMQISSVVSKETERRSSAYYSNIGIAYGRLNDYKKSIEYLSKSVSIGERSTRVPKLELAISINNLASSYYHVENYSKAIELMSRAIKIAKESVGDRHYATLSFISSLATVYHELKDYKKAIELHNQSLEGTKAVYGEHHHSIAVSYTNIGQLYLSLKDYPTALDFSMKALNISKSTMGADHIYTAICYLNLGSVYQAIPDYKQAIEAYSMSLSLFEKASTDENVKVGKLCFVIAEMYEETRNYTKSVEFFEKALKSKRKVFGEESSKVIKVYIHLAGVNSQLGNNLKSLELFHRALELSNKINYQDLDTIYACSNLASMYQQKQDFKKAEEFSVMAISQCEKVSGKDSPMAGLLFYILAEIYEAVGDKQKAMDGYSRSLSGVQETFGYDHWKAIEILRKLAEGYFELKDYQKSLENYVLYVEMQKMFYGEFHFSIAEIYFKIVEIQRALEDYEGMLYYWMGILEIYKKEYGEESEPVEAGYQGLIMIYTNLNNPEKAKEAALKSEEMRKKRETQP